MTARVLFIGGLGRSGSTLVDRVLGQTPDVCSVGELVFLWERGLLANERCGCGEAFRSCPFWTEVGEKAFGGWDQVDPEEKLALQRRVDRNRYVPWILLPALSRSYRQRLRGYGEMLARIYIAIGEVSGARLVVDSSKHASTAAIVSRLPGIDSRIVQLVRDPRGVAWSWAKVVSRPDTPEAGTEMARLGSFRASARWQAYNLLLAVVRRPGRGQAVRYEDFVDRPAHATRRLLAFGGVAGSFLPQFVSDRRVVLAVDHTVAGNPLRFRTGELEIRADDEWRDSMPRRRRLLVSALTFPTSAVFRYMG